MTLSRPCPRLRMRQQHFCHGCGKPFLHAYLNRPERTTTSWLRFATWRGVGDMGLNELWMYFYTEAYDVAVTDGLDGDAAQDRASDEASKRYEEWRKRFAKKEPDVPWAVAKGTV